MSGSQRPPQLRFSDIRPLSRQISLHDVPTDQFTEAGMRRPFVCFNPRAEGPRGYVKGRYLLGEAVGFGGTSTIHSAVDRRTGEMVAIKMASPNSEFANSSVIREADALSSISHPSVVRFIDSGTHRDSAFVVMEYIRAMDLHSMIGDFGPLQWSATAPMLLELCDTIHLLHGMDLIHGDVKPANVMVLPVPEGYFPSVKLVDFGMSRRPSEGLRMEEDTRPEFVFGTIEYIAPEQFLSSKAYYDIRADVYSFGVMMYSMLTRKNPFLETGNCDVQRMLTVLNHDPPHPSSLNRTLPEDAGDVVMRAIAKAPAERYQSMEALADAIISTL